MKDKTKEAISDVVLKIRCGLTKQEALAKICAIVDEERKGEVVLAEGEFFNCLRTNWKSVEFDKFLGRKGRLIFVEDKEAK